MVSKRFSTVGLIIAFIFFSALVAANSPSSAAVGPATFNGLHVSGPNIVSAAGLPVVLHGVDRSGGEFGCVQSGASMWNGPMDQASITAMLSWKINAVRVPLNEDCWLGINGANPGGTTYQNNVVSYVNLAISNGLYVILDLHWTNAGSTLATGQQPMPDSDHAPTFWQQVATTFKNNGSVIFDLFNEPYPDSNQDTAAAWSCWKNGGTCSGMSYPAAGMQTLVTTVRNTGANNLIMLGGVEYSNSLTQWLANKPTDPANNLAASWHSYNFNICSNSTCWNNSIAPVMQQVPVIAGEIGENDCAHGYIDSLMAWMDSHNASYLGWTWNNWDCSSGPALITDYTGTPTAFGQGFKNHLASLGSGATNTPAPTATKTSTPAATKTNTPIATGTTGPTKTHTPTFVPPTNTPAGTAASGALKVQIQTGGTDNTQQTAFHLNIVNTSSASVSNISVRVYFQLDGSQTVSKYVIEKYWDQSGVVTISGPTLASGSIYYYTLSYGSTALAAGAAWQYQGALHLSDWSTNFSAANDAFHTGYAVGSLPANYTDDTHLPAYVNGTLVWGVTP
jgi:hypothetical protein